MGTPRSEESFEELFAHEEWVRRLAFRLCGGSADDVTQDTWIEALRRPNQARSARAWLGGIVRHLSRHVAHDERERARRELDAARDAVVPGPEALLARAELQQRVLTAVAGLDEPYRVVVLMRYYEGLKTDDIAERLSLPASTVRNRLARAHERLRAKLDNEYGGDHAAWSALFAPGLASLAPHQVAAGVGITMKLIALSAASALVLGAFLYWRAPSADAKLANERTTAFATGETPLRESQSAVAPVPAASNERLPARTEPPPSVEHVLVWGSILGAGDLPSTNAQASFWDEDGTSHPATLGKNATYSAFGLRPGHKTLHISIRGYMPIEEELELLPDQDKVRHDVTLSRALVLPVKIVAKDGRTLVKTLADDCEPSVVATRDQPTRIANTLGRSSFNSGVGQYRARSMFDRDAEIPEGYSGVLEIHVEAPVWVSSVIHDSVIESRLVRGNESELVFEIDPAVVESKLGALAFQCVDASTGASVEGARVELWFQDGGGTTGKVGEHGLAHFERLAPGMRRFVITAPHLARFETWIKIPSGNTLDLGLIELHPMADGRGRVVDAEGHGIRARIIAIPTRALASPRAADPNMSGESVADGSFRLSWAERGALRLIALNDDFAIGAIDVDAAHSASTDLEIRLEKGTPITVRSARGSTGTVEFVIADAEGRTLRFCRAHPESATHVQLKPGRYELGVVEDDEIVRREPLDVGTDPIVREMRAP